MYTRKPHPGKYEGNGSQAIARAVHLASLDGGCSQECGDADLGEWYGLVLGRRFTFLVSENSQGFVSVEVFKDRAQAQAKFARLALAIDRVADYEPEGDGLTLRDEIDAAYHVTE